MYLKVKHSNTGNPVFRLLHMLFLASEVREIEISELFLTYNDVSLWNLLHVPIKYTKQ